MNGLLIRVGIDGTDGRWNAPVAVGSNEFVYVPIIEEKPIRAGFETVYDDHADGLSRLGVELPAHLRGVNTHLDPDFDHLTYGDQGQRARRIRTLKSGDVLAFFAALQPIRPPHRPLLYAIIGFYVIEEIVDAVGVPKRRWAENAHTRRVPTADDIVVRARPRVSGRLRRCIPIGEYRNRAYRVRSDLIKAWGGLDVNDGYIQRSANPPRFDDARRFYRWFRSHRPNLIDANNP